MFDLKAVFQFGVCCLWADSKDIQILSNLVDDCWWVEGILKKLRGNFLKPEILF